MKRGRLKLSDWGCYHLTHRCQERRFLLKFDEDRKNYQARLREAAAKYQISVLDYMITSNHVHLLIFSENSKNLSEAMQFLQGCTAKDYNRRKHREGSFWSGRYHPTLIQNGPHLSRCLFYIGLNMIRAGVVRHPSEWKYCGYQEITGRRQRYRIIDIERLLRVLGMRVKPEKFFSWYNKNMESMIKSENLARQSIWTECSAVGDKAWIEQLSAGYNIGKKEIMSFSSSYQQDNELQVYKLKENTHSYGLKLSSRKGAGFIK